MTVTLPKSIDAYFKAGRDGGTGDLAAIFCETAVVKDEGRTHVGHGAIGRWREQAAKTYGPLAVEPIAVERENGRTKVTARVSGDFPGSPVDLRYDFRLDDGRIAALEISA